MAYRDYDPYHPHAASSPSHPPRRDYGGRRTPIVLLTLIAAVLAGSAAFLVGGGLAKADEVRFQKASEPGPGAFTEPVDVPRDGGESSSTASGDSGVASSGTSGSGSPRVCDREKLIRELASRPDRLRAWAEVLGVEPTEAEVAAYIRQLRPVTLTEDTQVTNHSYSNGGARSFQAILESGTAVLVDRDGNLVARCACGNPLLEPVELVVDVTCYECPRDLEPPSPCDESSCYTAARNAPPVRAPETPVCPDYPGDSGDDAGAGGSSVPPDEEADPAEPVEEEPADSLSDDPAGETADTEDPSMAASEDETLGDTDAEDPYTSDDSDEEDPYALGDDELAAEDAETDETAVDDTEGDDPYASEESTLDEDIEDPSTGEEEAGEEDPDAVTTDAPVAEESAEEEPATSACDDTPTDDGSGSD